MAITPRGIWTPDSGEEYDLTVDAATTASTIDEALQKAANYGLGTQAEMNAAVNDFPNGAMWFNTTNNTEYRRVAGAWVSAIDDTGWVDLTLLNGWSVQSGRSPQVRRLNGVVYMQGHVTGGSDTVIANLPAGFLGPSLTHIVPNYDTTAYFFQISSSGVVSTATGGVGRPVTLIHSWVEQD